jgi:predicted helicase
MLLKKLLVASFSLPGVPPHVDDAAAAEFQENFVFCLPLIYMSFDQEMLKQNQLLQWTKYLCQDYIKGLSKERIDESKRFWMKFLESGKAKEHLEYCKYVNGESEELLKWGYQEFRHRDKNKSNRDGIWFTPYPVISYMVRSTAQLLQRDYDRDFGDEEIDILDPATGIACYLTDILRRIPESKRKAKYQSGNFCGNDIDLLACFLGRLNMENTYYLLSGEFLPFYGIRCVNTLSDEYLSCLESKDEKCKPDNSAIQSNLFA